LRRVFADYVTESAESCSNLNPHSEWIHDGALEGMETVGAFRILTLLLIGCCSGAQAADLRISVIDARDLPVPGVAIVVALDVSSVPAPRIAIMDQINEQFVPELLIIQTGSQVEFPNSDAVLHHVYSFSNVIQFELALFRGREHPPVTFDQPGLVVVGCNIHDQMVGHILVVDSPWHGITDERGVVAFADIPESDYRITAFHPELQTLENLTVTGSTGVAAQREVSIYVPHRRGRLPNEALVWEDY